jgi:hypothetical protein
MRRDIDEAPGRTYNRLGVLILEALWRSFIFII